MRSPRRLVSTLLGALVAMIVGAAIGCSPEPSASAPAADRAPIAPVPAWTPPQRSRLRPTMPLPIERPADQGVVPPGGRAPEAEGAPPLTVEADAVPDIGKAPLRVHLDARVDAGADTYSCDWDFGDGTTATGNPVDHEFTAPGSYTAQVRVTTSNGATGSYSVGIQVDAAADDADEDGGLVDE